MASLRLCEQLFFSQRRRVAKRKVAIYEICPDINFLVNKKAPKGSSIVINPDCIIVR